MNTIKKKPIRLGDRWRVVPVALFIGWMVSACSIVPETPTSTVYSLPEGQINVAPITATASTKVVRIITPLSSNLIDSRRILVYPEDGKINAYKGVRWDENAPVMLRNRLINSLRTHGQIRAVSSEQTKIKAPLEIASDLTRFQVQYENGAPVVHVQLDAFLMQTQDSKILATKRFSFREPANAPEVEAIVKTFGRAAEQLEGALLQWLLPYL